MLKLPGPKGGITVRGDFRRSDDCDREFSRISESFGVQEQLAEIALDNDRTVFPEPKKPTPENSFSAKNDTRAHRVHPADNDKAVLVTSSLDEA